MTKGTETKEANRHTQTDRETKKKKKIEREKERERRDPSDTFFLFSTLFPLSLHLWLSILTYLQIQSAVHSKRPYKHVVGGVERVRALEQFSNRAILREVEMKWTEKAKEIHTALQPKQPNKKSMEWKLLQAKWAEEKMEKFSLKRRRKLQMSQVEWGSGRETHVTACVLCVWIPTTFDLNCQIIIMKIRCFNDFLCHSLFVQ